MAAGIKPKLVKMTKEEMAIWQKLEAMKREASKAANEALGAGAVGVLANPDPQTRLSQEYWYQRGKTETTLEILGFMKYGQ